MVFASLTITSIEGGIDFLSYLSIITLDELISLANSS